MKPSKPVKKVSPPVVLGAEIIAFEPSRPVAENILYASAELSTASDTGSDDPRPATLGVTPGAIDGVNWPNDWHEGQEGWPKKGEESTGGRSEKIISPPKETAKPSSPISPKPPVKPLLSQPVPKSPQESRPDMPVLGDLRGVGEEKGGGVVHPYPQVPFTPENEPPFATDEEKVSSPFITGNERIDRRTAFTQYCRLGEGRTYVKVANLMAIPLESIKKWAKEDNWANAYRERVTADVLQVAKEENIHEVLDIRREVIAQLKAKITDAKNGKDVFKNTKEMLDTMLKLEELTGAKDASSVRAGQIFVIISAEEWEAREKLNEKARKEEANQ
jgi:hypothetical protein